MRILFALMILTVLATSCMSHNACPAYGGARKRANTMSAKKMTKYSRDRTPYYKAMKAAERD
jgi:hypothetical protein